MDRLNGARMFVTVVDTGSFAAAAQRLGTSSGQASKLVSQLEAELGAQLLKRTTRALALTEIGTAYHARMKTLLEDLDALDVSVRNTTGTPRGRLRLTAPLSFGKLRLLPLLLDFAQAFPEIQLDVDFSDTMRNIVDDGYDIAIRVGNSTNSGLIVRKLCNARICLVASPAYLARRPAPSSPDEIAQHECIIDSNYRDPVNWRFLPPGAKDVLNINVSGKIRLSNGEACLAAAEAGMGLAQMPSFIAQQSIEDGHVQRLLKDWEDKPFGVYAIYPPARHLALKVRALVDYLAGAMVGNPE